MTYDRREAEAILLRSHEKRDPSSHYRAREASLRALLDAVMESSKATGHETGIERGCHVISHRRQGAVFFRLEDESLLISDTPEPDLGTKNWSTLPIEYDAGIGMFVGAADDCFYQVDPGQPKRRRSAVTAIAEVVADRLDKQTQLRRAGQ